MSYSDSDEFTLQPGNSGILATTVAHKQATAEIAWRTSLQRKFSRMLYRCIERMQGPCTCLDRGAIVHVVTSRWTAGSYHRDVRTVISCSGVYTYTPVTLLLTDYKSAACQGYSFRQGAHSARVDFDDGDSFSGVPRGSASFPRHIGGRGTCHCQADSFLLIEPSSAAFSTCT